MLANKI